MFAGRRNSTDYERIILRCIVFAFIVLHLWQHFQRSASLASIPAHEVELRQHAVSANDALPRKLGEGDHEAHVITGDAAGGGSGSSSSSGQTATSGAPASAAAAAAVKSTEAASTPAPSTGPISDPANRDILAIFVLDTSGARSHEVLSLAENVRQRILPDTPSTIYIAVPEHAVADYQTRLQSALSEDHAGQEGQAAGADADGNGGSAATHAGDGRVIVVSLTQTGWGAAPEGDDISLYAGPWGKEYRLMGDWRLWHMPRYAKALGHQYVLQVDADSVVGERLGYNIVSTFRAKALYMGARKVHVRDIPAVNWGLAELLRFFLVAEGVVPKGRLFANYTRPAGLEGLYTGADQKIFLSEAQEAAVRTLGVSERSPMEAGWQTAYLHGNFVVLDLDFFTQPLITRFVHLARVSGGSMRFRWNEQAVVGAVFQAFVPEASFHQFQMVYNHAGVHFGHGEY